MRENPIDYGFQQLQKLNTEIPFEVVIGWVYEAKVQKSKKQWLNWLRWW